MKRSELVKGYTHNVEINKKISPLGIWFCPSSSLAFGELLYQGIEVARHYYRKSSALMIINL